MKALNSNWHIILLGINIGVEKRSYGSKFYIDLGSFNLIEVKIIKL